MRRREFITLLGAAAWPVVARAQQGSAIKRIGVMNVLPADDPEWQARLAAFHQGLQESGWTIGRNIRVEYRLGLGDGEELRRRATELVALAPLELYRLCLRASAIPSAPAMSQVWRSRAATPPVSLSSNMA